MGVLNVDYEPDLFGEFMRPEEQYSGRRILVCWEIIFVDGWRKEESYDMSIGAPHPLTILLRIA